MYKLAFSVARTADDCGYGGARAGSLARTPETTPGGAATSASMSSLNAQHGEDEEHVEEQIGQRGAGAVEREGLAAPVAAARACAIGLRRVRRERHAEVGGGGRRVALLAGRVEFDGGLAARVTLVPRVERERVVRLGEGEQRERGHDALTAIISACPMCAVAAPSSKWRSRTVPTEVLPRPPRSPRRRDATPDARWWQPGPRVRLLPRPPGCGRCEWRHLASRYRSRCSSAGCGA